MLPFAGLQDTSAQVSAGGHLPAVIEADYSAGPPAVAAVAVATVVAAASPPSPAAECESGHSVQSRAGQGWGLAASGLAVAAVGAAVAVPRPRCRKCRHQGCWSVVSRPTPFAKPHHSGADSTRAGAALPTPDR